jgi:hypothetical protein
VTDPRIEAAARALCVLGGGHTTDGTYPDCDHVAQHEDGARVALAAADAVDPVREAARSLIEAWDEDFIAEVRALNALCVALGVEGTEDRIARRFAADD